MSDPHNPPPADLAPNGVLYHLLKPAPVLGPQGQKQYQIVGVTQDFSAAISWANENAPATVAVNVILYMTQSTLAIPPAKA